MPYKDPLKAKQNKKEYYQKNKDKIKKYHQSPKGKMINTISSWKFNGLICENREEYEYIYDRWLNSERCEECNKEYTEDNIKNMDHCHLTGLFRNILCHSCNMKRQDNSSGISNIIKNKNGWQYRIVIKGQRHQKYSNDLEWLKEYKIKFEKENVYNN
mgnify:FL=1